MEEPACPGCRRLEAELEKLREEVRRLTALLGRNSSNSSLPPSANPPSAPSPVKKPKSGRRPGGQPGHAPQLRQLLPPERVTRVVPFLPERCAKCDAPLPVKA